MSRPSARASPDQNDEKFPDPFASALVRGGSEAWVSAAPYTSRYELPGDQDRRCRSAHRPNRHGVDDLRHERKGPDLRIEIRLDEHATVAASLGALGNDDIALPWRSPPSSTLTR
jgi:hypothetical protein